MSSERDALSVEADAGRAITLLREALLSIRNIMAFALELLLEREAAEAKGDEAL